MQRDVERKRDGGPAVRPQAASPRARPRRAPGTRIGNEGLVQLAATESASSPEDDASLLQRLIDDLGARKAGDGALITVPLDVGFAPGTADLAADAGRILARLAQLAHLYDAGTVSIDIGPPTSADRGAGGALPQQRAQAVADALASAYGLRTVVAAAVAPAAGGPVAMKTIRVELRR